MIDLREYRTLVKAVEEVLYDMVLHHDDINNDDYYIRSISKLSDALDTVDGTLGNVTLNLAFDERRERRNNESSKKTS